MWSSHHELLNVLPETDGKLGAKEFGPGLEEREHTKLHESCGMREGGMDGEKEGGREGGRVSFSLHVNQTVRVNRRREG